MIDVCTLVAPPEGGRLDRTLARLLPDLSRTRLQALVREGAVTVDGLPGRPSLQLKGGETLEVRLPPAPPSDLTPEDIPLDISYVDDDLVVVCKPAGLVVHPARGHPTGTLVHALLHAFPDLADQGGHERPGVVHRLDKGTSGLLVVARHDLALRRLQAQFLLRTTRREYLAVVHGVPGSEEGVVDAALARHPSDRLRISVVATGGRRAVTHWRRLDRTDGLSLLSCRLETGRTHQVRVHLASIGHPVVGDPLYGGRRERLPERLQAWTTRLDHQLLHAARLGFQHPITGVEMDFSAPPPPDFLAFCQEAGLAGFG
ncbi:MAG: RluA family pseudouridine synthase [Deltaproteobacteria bacterium]|nr:RluA family pseudouridine synthase [Deltaproteobacteria bacterium]